MTPPPGAGAYAVHLDVQMRSATAEGATVVFHAKPHHLNAFGVLHGGVVMTLLDMAMGAGVAQAIAPGETTASIQISTDFVRAGAPGELEARGRVDRRGRTLAFVSGELWQNGERIARASGIWTIRPARA